MRNLKLQEVDEWLWKADFTGRKEGSSKDGNSKCHQQSGYCRL